MITLYIVRHGDSTYQFDGYRNRPLSPLGVEQAIGIANTLQNTHLDAIISSSSPRAIQTVQPLADLKKMPIQTNSAFQELDVHLDRSQISKEEARESVLNILTTPSFAYPNGESRRDVEQRSLPALFQLLKDYDEQTVLLCSHGIAITILLSALDPSIGYDFWKAMKKPDVFCCEVDKKQVLTLRQIPLPTV